LLSYHFANRDRAKTFAITHPRLIQIRTVPDSNMHG
jgi:hypothetical protein